MQIETYEIEEVKGELDNMAADSEAMELCRKLELYGQLALSEAVTETRFQYPRMTLAEITMFSVLFSERTEIREYKAGIIPLRVLQVAAFCRESQFIKSLYVWHPKIVKDDPILVASTAENQKYGSGEHYLVARWGNALEPMEKLVERARPLWIAQQKQLLNGFKKRIETWEQDLDNIATEVLTVGRDFTPNLYD